jgi:hypothetical protein
LVAPKCHGVWEERDSFQWLSRGVC